MYTVKTLVLLEIVETVFPIVPVGKTDKQCHRCNHRNAHRQNDRQQDSDLARTVNARRFNNSFRDVRGEVRAHHDHVERVDHEGRNDERPNRVAHLDVTGVHDVRRHKTAGEQHREEHVERKTVAARQVAAGKRVSHEDCHGKAAHRTHNRGEDCDAVRGDNLIAALKHVLVSIQTECLREQRVAVADQFLLVRNGGHDEQKEREDAAQGKDDHHNVCADLKPFVFFDHGVSLSLP